MKARPDLALALMRVTVGFIHGWHGFQKIFTTGLSSVTAHYTAGGVPLPLLTAPLTAILELLGGLLLILGLGARGIAGALFIMLLLVLLPKFQPGGGPPLPSLEAPLLLLLGTLAIMIGGTGFPSIEHLRTTWRTPPAPVTSPKKKKG